MLLQTRLISPAFWTRLQAHRLVLSCGHVFLPTRTVLDMWQIDNGPAPQEGKSAEEGD